MGLFDRLRPPHHITDGTTAGGVSATAAANLPQRVWSYIEEAGGAKWRVLVESSLIGLGALVVSVAFIWAVVTDRVSVDAIVVIIVLLILTLFAVGQGRHYYRRNLALQARAREAVTKTTLAAEILMEFLREFTLKNQETISRLAEGQKARVVDDVTRAIDDLVRSLGDTSLRRELLRLKETVAQKVAEIPTGVTLPLPRLEYFDQALRQLEEPERTPACPACGAKRVRVGRVDGRNGIHYACVQCGHEFSLGIGVMLEKHS
jgi:DNA-directed RNA polymerase subunit RPC12/RpoP